MFLKNTSGQFVYFTMINVTTGAPVTGITPTCRRCIDGTFAAATGTITEDTGLGFYKMALSQADTNGNDIGYRFLGTGAIDTVINIVTTSLNPYDATRFGMAALPNAAAEAAGGLFTRGTGAGQINQDANGRIDVNLLAILGTTLTETAGQIAGAFKQFFNIGSPTGTVNLCPTTTNLTNAPTNGDFTATMKTSLNAATPASITGAVGSVTGNVGGNVTGTVGSVVGAVGSVTGAVGSVTGNVGGNVVGTVASVVGAVASVTGNVGGNVTGSVGSLGTTAKTDVKLQVTDALNVDTYAQVGQGAPPATTTLRLMIAYLYKAFRNKTTQDASQYSLYNDDAATVDQKAAVSDDGTTFTRGEVASGP